MYQRMSKSKVQSTLGENQSLRQQDKKVGGSQEQRFAASEAVEQGRSKAEPEEMRPEQISRKQFCSFGRIHISFKGLVQNRPAERN